MNHMLLKRSRSMLAMEMIDFQTDSFGADLEAAITAIYAAAGNTNSRKKFEELPETRALEELVFKRLGLRIKIKVQDMASIMPFYANKHHALLDPFWHNRFEIKDQNEIIKNINGKTGTVDLKNAKLGGIFSEYTHTVCLNFPLLRNYKVSPAEVTGILLHEFGHGFTYYEFSDRLTRSNQVLLKVAQELGKETEKNLTYVYREIKSVNEKITEAEIDDIVNGPRLIAGPRLFKATIGAVTDEMKEKCYALISSEQLADQFSNRFGYGRETVTGLQKIHEAFGSADVIRGGTFFAIIHDLIFYSTIAISAIGAFMSGMPLVGLVVVFFLVLGTILSGDNFDDFTYDKLKQRYKRIRMDCVQGLKNLEAEPAQIKQLIDDIKTIDDVMSRVNVPDGLMKRIANVLLPRARAVKNDTAEQQLLEELASNELFFKAAQLRTN